MAWQLNYTNQKLGIIFKEVSYAHQDWIYFYYDKYTKNSNNVKYNYKLKDLFSVFIYF